MHPKDLALTTGHLCNLVDRGQYGGILRIPGIAEGYRQIVGSNQQGVDPRDCGNSLDLLDRRSGFDLGDGQHLFVGRRHESGGFTTLH